MADRNETRVRELRAAEAIALSVSRTGNAKQADVVRFVRLRRERLELEELAFGVDE